MKVKNIETTLSKIPNCDFWMRFWRAQSSGQRASLCRVVGCCSNDVVGTFVRKENDSNKYVIPFCKNHNQQNDEKWVEIEEGASLVPVC